MLRSATGRGQLRPVKFRKAWCMPEAIEAPKRPDRLSRPGGQWKQAVGPRNVEIRMPVSHASLTRQHDPCHQPALTPLPSVATGSAQAPGRLAEHLHEMPAEV